MKTERNLLVGVIGLLSILCVSLWLHPRPAIVLAQGPGMPSMEGADGTSTQAQCILPATWPSGMTWRCFSGDGKTSICVKCTAPGVFVLQGSGSGAVMKVAGIAPDASGNVPLTATTKVAAPTFNFTGAGALTINPPQATTTIP